MYNENEEYRESVDYLESAGMVLRGTVFDVGSEANRQYLESHQNQEPEGTQNGKPKPRTDEEFWEKCRIPLRFRHTESNLTWRAGWSSMFVLIKNKIEHTPGFCLVIRGPRGTGKTQLGIEALKYAYCVKNKKVMMTSAYKIQLATTASFKDDKKTVEDVLKDFTRPDLLLIDEFDWRPEGRESYHNENLFYILDDRYQWMKSTILTSNATIEEFANNTDPGILSRMSETGGRIDTDKFENLRMKQP